VALYKVTALVYSFSICPLIPSYNTLNLNHSCSLVFGNWFQFADDAAVISSQEKENQILLNRFSVWCRWANMIIRVDKCSTFGIKKHSSKSIQYQPKLFVNHLLVPRIEIGESFRYLGRYFNFNMLDEKHQSEICDLFNNIVSKIDELHLHPRNKILLYSRYLLSKISWDFTITYISQTWVCETVDGIATKYIRKWLARTANFCNCKQCLSPLQQIWLKCHSTFNEIYRVPNCLSLSFKVIDK
jgi:hypothetical protein